MNIATFPEANSQFGPPPGLTEEQVGTVPAFNGVVRGGSMDGSTVIVTAWKPDAADLKRLLDGGVIYLSCINILPAHMITTDFQSAIQPA